MGVTSFRGRDGKMKIIASSGMHAESRYKDTEILEIESQTLVPAADYPDVSSVQISMNLIYFTFFVDCN